VPYSRLSFSNIWKNCQYVKRAKASVYHITGDIHYVVMGLRGKKIVLTIHDCVFLHASSGLKRSILKWLFLDMPVRMSTVITTISEKSRDEIIRFSNCAPEKVLVIPNPVSSLVQYVPKVFNSLEPVILFIGSTPNKNLEGVIGALKGINCRLCIVGVVNDEQAKRLENNHISYSVHTNVSEERLASLYAECDMLLFPSTYEGFGLPVIEAQKAGRVVITSNMTPMNKVAGEGAFLIDPYNIESIAEAIKEVIGNPMRREKIIASGFDNVKQYEAGKIAEAYREVYQSIH
jgi:glycosyltransferase involved in cell wall biosynthesis